MPGRVMIVLYTDFGAAGPYLGQMKAAIYREAPDVTIVDLLADAPMHNPRLAAYLLAALTRDFPPGTVFLGVVDPGVGDPQRRPAAVWVDGQWFVGPDNGLFNVVAMRGQAVRWWDITWRPQQLSASFHGRDLFAPVAARIARGEPPPGTACEVEDRLLANWPQDLAEIIYIDHFGNAITGVRAAVLSQQNKLCVAGVTVDCAATFSAVPPGQAFWYENSSGLAEIAINCGRVDDRLGVAIGDRVDMV